jgi:N-acetylglucosamine malate deacetylase 1
MATSLLAIGAHDDDCVFGILGILGILRQAARKHHRIVILSIIGDYGNWSPT